MLKLLALLVIFQLAQSTELSDQNENVIKLANQLAAAESMTCEVCKIIFTNAKLLAKNKAKDKELLLFVEKNFCGRLGEFNQSCNKYLKTISETILALIEQDIKPEQLCQMFELCNDRRTEEVFFNPDKPQTSIPATLDANNCVVCQFLIKLLDQELNKNSTEIQIKTGLEKVCNLLVLDKSEQKCSKFAETYTDTFISMIVKRMPAKYICDKIGFCNIRDFLQHADVNEIKKVLIGSKEKKINVLSEDSPKLTIQCVMCDFSVDILDNMIQMNMTKDQIIDAMKNICDKKVPAHIKAEFNQFVNKYGMIIIDKLMQNMDPAIICQKMNLCPKPATKVNLLGAEKIYEKLPKEILAKESVDLADFKHAKLVKTVSPDLKVLEEKKGDDSIDCSICTYAAQLTNNFLNNKKTTNEIKQALKLVCNNIPAKFFYECSAFITQYGSYVIQLIAVDLDSKEVCTELNCVERRRN